MPGEETGGVSNFWYSFDYGLAHFVSIDGETDFANSPEWSFAEDIKGNEVVKATSQLLREDHERGKLNFHGNVEGNDIFKGTTDVVNDLAADQPTVRVTLADVET